jgi:uncharacterized protein (TIGR02646 family)
MIRVARGTAPPGFAARAISWNTRFAQLRQANPHITASAVWKSVRPEIRPDAEILAHRFHHKCAYCEARPSHVSYPHIEHFQPKGLPRFEDRMFEWDNWLFSCGICNEEKWKHFPEKDGHPLLLDPTQDDPSEHLCFAGANLRGITKRGRKTVKLVDLDRQPLRNERALWLSLLNSLLLLWAQSADESVRRECREHLIWALQDDAPFAGMTRTYLAEKCPKVAAPSVLHAQLEEHDRLHQMNRLVKRHAEDIRQLT